MVAKTMAQKKIQKKPRSPTTGKVFEAFIAELRADPLVDDAACERLEAVLTSGDTINATSLKEALFPEKGADQK